MYSKTIYTVPVLLKFVVVQVATDYTHKVLSVREDGPTKPMGWRPPDLSQALLFTGCNKILQNMSYANFHSRYSQKNKHGGCCWPGAYLGPGHLQPLWWRIGVNVMSILQWLLHCASEATVGSTSTSITRACAKPLYDRYIIQKKTMYETYKTRCCAYWTTWECRPPRGIAWAW